MKGMNKNDYKVDNNTQSISAMDWNLAKIRGLTTTKGGKKYVARFDMKHGTVFQSVKVE